MRHLFSLFFFSLLLLACTQNESQTTTQTNINIPPTRSIPVEPIEMYAGVDQLRVRDLPSLKGRVLVELLEGDTLYFLNAETIRRTKLTLRDKTYNAPWIKVRTKDGKEGWTYGGAVVAEK